MTIDHIAHWGLISDPVMYDVFRSIGRIAMPLFCMLVAYGVIKSRNPWKFALRLLVFAVAVQVFLNLYLYENLFVPGWYNVFFTLGLGVVAASLIKTSFNLIKKHNADISFGKVLLVAGTFVGMIFVVVLPFVMEVIYDVYFDYGVAGVLLVVMFYVAIQHSMKALKIAAPFIVVIWCYILPFTVWWPIQWFAILSVPFIWVFVDRKLRISVIEKYAFYVFYPLHIAVIFFIQTLV